LTLPDRPIPLIIARHPPPQVDRAVIFVTASLTDWLDGRVARRRNQVTQFGTLLDPVADKLLVAAALVALVQVEMIGAWVAMVIIGRELAVTGLRGVALSMGVVVPASNSARSRRFAVRRHHDPHSRAGRA
jgi:CDP-diacylglycerol--glycerol-3-phosphate 3-phosphatidyltransferase